MDKVEAFTSAVAEGENENVLVEEARKTVPGWEAQTPPGEGRPISLNSVAGLVKLDWFEELGNREKMKCNGPTLLMEAS